MKNDRINSPATSKSLAYNAALDSPCASCNTSPCCQFLPLHTFELNNMVELNHAVYLLNFENIELGLSENGEWSVYYGKSCRHLNKDNYSCKIHDQESQPKICKHYNPYSCWYKHAFENNASEHFLRINSERMDFIISHLEFDDERNITSVPDWQTMMAGFRDISIQVVNQKENIENIAIANNTNPVPNQPSIDQVFGYSDKQNPCNDCGAHCCKTLIFPHSFPISRSNLDYFRFCLGFPGIELAIIGDACSILVNTTCRHVSDNQCILFGKKERPLLCKYYDAWDCSYKPLFAMTNEQSVTKLKLEDFDDFVGKFQFDGDGLIVDYVSGDAEMVAN